MTSPVGDWLSAHLQCYSLSLFDPEASTNLTGQWTVECHDNVHTLDWRQEPVWSVLDLAEACNTLNNGSLSQAKLRALQQMVTGIISRVEQHRIERKKEPNRMVSETCAKLLGPSRASLEKVVLPTLQAALENLTGKLA